MIGTTYGVGDGSTTFTLPNFNDKHLKGTTNTSSVGSNVGSDTVTLNTAQLPSHSHSQSHTHTVNHDHTAVHGHNSNGAGSAGSHSHTDGNYAGNATSIHTGHNHSVSGDSGSAGSHNHEPQMYSLLQWNNSTWLVARRTSYVSQDGGYYSIPFTNTAPGTGMAVTYHNGAFTTANNHSHSDGTYDSDAGGNHSHSFNVAGNSGSGGGHTHNVSVSASNSSTGAASPTSSGPSNNNTGNAGSGNTVSVIPSSVYARWLIRATGTINATAQDGAQILSEAREEVVTLELAGSGSLPASSAGAAYYRVPWAATLTAVKANRNGTNTNGSVTIDVNEGGTSVLSTEITIDQNEATSLTAVTPAVISDSAIANDALLTFDIDSANTSDEGPLTVTLYFTRED